MCRQVSESPIVLPGFLFLHVLTHFYICLSIVLKHVHLDPHPWRSLFACVGAHLCFFPCLSLMWSSFPLLGRSLQPPGLLERKWVLACFTLTSDRCVAWTCTTRAQQFPCPVTKRRGSAAPGRWPMNKYMYIYKYMHTHWWVTLRFVQK